MRHTDYRTLADPSEFSPKFPLQLQRDDVHDGGGGGGRQLSYGERAVARNAAARSTELEVSFGFFPIAISPIAPLVYVR